MNTATQTYSGKAAPEDRLSPSEREERAMA